MTFVDAHRLTVTQDCTVPGCTGEAWSNVGLCRWHHENGTPAQYGNPTSLSRGGVKPPVKRKRQPDLARLEQIVSRTALQLERAQADHAKAVRALDQARDKRAA